MYLGECKDPALTYTKYVLVLLKSNKKKKKKGEKDVASFFVNAQKLVKQFVN